MEDHEIEGREGAMDLNYTLDQVKATHKPLLAAAGYTPRERSAGSLADHAASHKINLKKLGRFRLSCTSSNNNDRRLEIYSTGNFGRTTQMWK